ncbi:MAG TPA: hypothetical protein VM009_07530, partial [Terriglobales bacterium]|nr:hypothetical protein [Terriglobales bacterium]
QNNLLGNFDPSVGIQQVGINLDSPYQGDHNNFAPRFGFAWDILGNGRTVIRGGGSMIYEIPILVTFLGQNGLNNATTVGINAIPSGAQGVPISGSIVSAATTQSTLNWSLAGPVFNVNINCDPTTGTPCDIMGVKKDLRTPYVVTYNVNLQQRLSPTTSLQVAYVGNRGVKLYSIRDINQVDPNSAAEIACGHCEYDGRPFRTLYPYLNYINFLENNYTSDYHGLQTTLTQRAWKGMNFVAGYTWSHAIDFASLIRAQQPQNSLNPRGERGNSSLDVRHRFTLSFTYDLPSVKSPAQLLEGWQMNSIVSLQSGTPYDAVDFGNDTSLTGEFSDRWNVIAPPSSIPNWSVAGPINIGAVLAQPAPGQFGNAGRNIFVGPPFRNWDFSLVKHWRLTERVNAQLRAEFFNVLNHPNFANPAILFTNDLSFPGSFGQVFATPDVAGANPVIGTGGPRNIQLGLKFRF